MPLKASMNGIWLNKTRGGYIKGSNKNTPDKAEYASQKYRLVRL